MSFIKDNRQISYDKNPSWKSQEFSLNKKDLIFFVFI